MRKSKAGLKAKNATTPKSWTQKNARTARSTKAASKPTKHRSVTPKGTQSHPLVETGYKVRDKEIERILITGRHEGLLEEYFGSSDYQELRELAQQSSRKWGHHGSGVTSRKWGQVL